MQNELLRQLHPGFLLKKFKNENEFANFQEEIYDNVTKCGFGDFIHSYGGDYAEEDDNYIGILKTGDGKGGTGSGGDDWNLNGLVTGNFKAGDDYAYEFNLDDDDLKIQSYYDRYHDQKLATGPGVIDGGGEAGIFLSMKNREHMWTPNAPKLEHVFTVDESGFYFLFYQICLTPQTTTSDGGYGPVQSTGNNDWSKFIFKEITSNFKLDFHYKNIDALGNVSYLTAGEMPLPHMFLYFTVSYTILLVIWLQSMKRDMSTDSKPTIYAIHHLMSAVVFLKILSMLFESIRYHFIRINGQADLWVSGVLRKWENHQEIFFAFLPFFELEEYSWYCLLFCFSVY